MMACGASDWGACPAAGSRANRAPGINGVYRGCLPRTDDVQRTLRNGHRAIDMVKARRNVDHDRVPEGGPETRLVGEPALHREGFGGRGLPGHRPHPGQQQGPTGGRA